ncbi:hypothetical protein AALB16_10875 [Lachnospiraceae bacterium 62-35]
MIAKEKKRSRKIIIWIALTIILLALTVFFGMKAGNQPKEQMGEQVSVKVKEIKVKSGMFHVAQLDVTVRYGGEEHRLRGVPFSAQFQMKSSASFRIPVTAYLYKDRLYYSPVCIRTWIDNLYYFFLAGTAACLVGILNCIGEYYREKNAALGIRKRFF